MAETLVRNGENVSAKQPVLILQDISRLEVDIQIPEENIALLGALSLSGMLIKNAIVLIDEINVQLRRGGDPWGAVIDESTSRVRPVLMAALTTVFGLVPLMADVFFGAMAVTIVVGLFVMNSERIPHGTNWE